MTFNDAVLCTSVQPTDVVLTGPGGPYTTTSLTSQDCDVNANGASYFDLVTDPPLSLVGIYTLNLVDSVVDLCGNWSTNGVATFYLGDGIDAAFVLPADTLYLPDTLGQAISTTPDAASCEWFIDTVAVSVDCAPVLSLPAAVGSYPITLVVVDSAGCSDTLTQWLVVADTSTIGIAELEHNGLHLSPNPTSDVLTVLLDEPADRAAVQVVDLTGRAVLSTTLSGTRLLLDVQALRPGSYTVRVGDGMVGRFVKR